MSDNQSSSPLPVFPKGTERRRRSPWWKRGGRSVVAGWVRLLHTFDFSGSSELRRRSPWWKRAARFFLTGWSRLIGSTIDLGLSIVKHVWAGLEVYLRGRQLRRLLYGLPALATLIGAAVMAGVLAKASSSDVRPAYRAKAQQARDAQKYEVARVCYLRLVREGKSQPEDLFGLSQTLRELKQDDQADTLLMQLTPLDGGYAQAHVVRARRLLSDPRRLPQYVVEAKKHLDKAVELRPDLTDAHSLLGQLLFRQQRWKDAEPHLRQAEAAEPGLAVLLMLAAENQGNAAEVSRWAERAETHYAQLLKTNPSNGPARLSLAEILVKEQKFDRAIAVLREGMADDPHPEYLKELGKAYALQVQKLPKDKTVGDTAVRWSLIEKGLREDPQNLTLLRHLLEITHGTDETAEQARSRLQELLAHGQSSAVLHLALGLDAYSRHKVDQARVHWERAFDLDPHMLVAANNVAWLLAHPEGANQQATSVVLACGVSVTRLPSIAQAENLKRALQLIEQVVKQAPKEAPLYASFRETRGQILALLGHWNESINDLEFALPLLANKTPIHQTLAQAYEELNLPELAAKHRKLAQQSPKP